MDNDFSLTLISEIQELSYELNKKIALLQQHIKSETVPVKILYERKLSKKEREKAFGDQVLEHMELLKRVHHYRRQFNLLHPPHKNRVKEYERTGNSKVFDGLRRKDT